MQFFMFYNYQAILKVSNYDVSKLIGACSQLKELDEKVMIIIIYQMNLLYVIMKLNNVQEEE